MSFKFKVSSSNLYAVTLVVPNVVFAKEREVSAFFPAMFENQLNNPKFVERAPAALVEDIRNKHAKSQDKLANIEQSIKALG